MSTPSESSLEIPKRTPPKYKLLDKMEPESSSSSESPLEVTKPKTPNKFALLEKKKSSASSSSSESSVEKKKTAGVNPAVNGLENFAIYQAQMSAPAPASSSLASCPAWLSSRRRASASR